jgi:hypothetical protein
MIELVQEIIEVIEEKTIIEKVKTKGRRRYLKGEELEDYILKELREDIEESFTISNIEHLIRIRTSETKESKHFKKFDYVIKANYRNILKKHPEIFEGLLDPVMKKSDIKKYVEEELEALYLKSVTIYLDEWELNKGKGEE